MYKGNDIKDAIKKNTITDSDSEESVVIKDDKIKCQ